jgi:hypothetical protein
MIQKYLDRCMLIHCYGNSFTEQLPSDSPGIVDVFACRYQATHIPSGDHCIATVLHLTNVYWNVEVKYFEGGF